MYADISATEDADNATPKEQLMEDLRAVVTDAEALLHATASQSGEGVASARARIKESLYTAKARLATAEAALVERTRQAARVTNEYVHENPWKAVGIGTCVGVNIGMLIARR